MFVSRCRYWWCARCQAVFEKPDLQSKIQQFSGPGAVQILSTGECAKCHAVYPMSEVYAGQHDVPRQFWDQLRQPVELGESPAERERLQTLVVSCSQCRRSIRVGANVAGKRIRCPHQGCGGVVAVPVQGTSAEGLPTAQPEQDDEPLPQAPVKSTAPPATGQQSAAAGTAPTAPPLKFPCPECCKQLQVPARLTGTTSKCPACGARLQIPTQAQCDAYHERQCREERRAADHIAMIKEDPRPLSAWLAKRGRRDLIRLESYTSEAETLIAKYRRKVRKALGFKASQELPREVTMAIGRAVFDATCEELHRRYDLDVDDLVAIIALIWERMEREERARAQMRQSILNNDVAALLVQMWMDGDREQSQATQTAQAVAEPKLPAGGSSLLSANNLGTRYDSLGKANSYWLLRQSKAEKESYLLYAFPNRDQARSALLELPCIQVAQDSQELICTEVLTFGYYQTEQGTFEAMLAGKEMTPTLFHQARAAFRKHGGKPQGTGELAPDGSSAAGSERQQARSTSAPTFVREYSKPNALGQLCTYRIHRATNAASAKAFLQAHPVNAPLLYVIVETPEGTWGRDKDGIYKE
jgi:hypothetical protein